MQTDSSRPPEQLYKSCEGMLHLHRKTEKGLFERACHLAIAVTTQMASEILGCSRPYIVKLLEEGKIDYTKIWN
jgi:hypothetical protein